MQSRVWLSYDLGIDGDYENLYSWLDSKEAVECGDSCASFFYSFRKDLVQELLKELKASVELRSKDRIYIISVRGNKIFGKFIYGKRKRAPWAGYAVEPGEEIMDEG
jgi:hypothetical protein